MDAKEIKRLPDPRRLVRADFREVIQEISGKPHLYIRLKLTGWHFPHRAREPFVVIGNVVSKRVIIDRDELVANAYFDKPIPAAERVSFGYGDTIAWDFDVPVEPRRIIALDRAKLPRGVIDLLER
ncbi:MAG TPA: hypothetical protein VGJ82_07870 [Thermoanaerobaculia bacterium]|jgi:hypothetical protein